MYLLTVRIRLMQLLACLLLVAINGCLGLSREPPWQSQLTPQQLGIIANRRDSLSLKIARYYQQQRGIPRENIITIEFNPQRTNISPVEFQRLKEAVDAKTPAHVQAFALTWASPYRVGCMSITSAFALGFDRAYCASGCTPTRSNPYFNSNSSRPYNDFRMRPTMTIAATNFEAAKSLIARGIIADGTRPRATAYLVSTSDSARNVRANFYPEIKQKLASYFTIKILKNNALEGKFDVMFYFTGIAQVEKLATNKFLPGAVADHLTSFGGQLTDSGQMSSIRWLEAGATGSYGTVVEPCNFPQKFPHPGILIYHYLRGETLIEAYWKSVAWPGQGLFIGEPLARPFSS